MKMKIGMAGCTGKRKPGCRKVRLFRKEEAVKSPQKLDAKAERGRKEKGNRRKESMSKLSLKTQKLEL